MNMDIRSRILKGRLLEEIAREPGYSEKLGLSDRSAFRADEAQRPQDTDRETESESPAPRPEA